jgi:hypothetical protein
MGTRTGVAIIIAAALAGAVAQVGALGLRSRGQAAYAELKGETFDKARLTMQLGSAIRDVDVILEYQNSALMIVDRDSGSAFQSLIYAEMTGGEYSYARPQTAKRSIWSPMSLFSSGKKHLFVARTTTDSAQLQLDESNYKQVLAVFESRTRKKVVTIGEGTR